jgi:hypothetical protein
VDEQANGWLRIQVNHPDLQMPGIGSQIPKATFDPRLGLDHPDVEVLDLGQPLVRRMLDMLKREAFEPDRDGAEGRIRYGRTAVTLTREVGEMTALYTLLVRYTTQTQPPQILEDLLTTAIPLYGSQLLETDQARRLLDAQPAAGTVTWGEARDVLSDALQRPDLEMLLTQSIEQRRQTLEIERWRLRETLQRQAGWMQGADRLKISSWDLLSVKVLWPV